MQVVLFFFSIHLTNMSCLENSCQFITDSNKKSTAYLVQVYVFFWTKVCVYHIQGYCYEKNVSRTEDRSHAFDADKKGAFGVVLCVVVETRFPSRMLHEESGLISDLVMYYWSKSKSYSDPEKTSQSLSLVLWFGSTLKIIL